jgi:hypothetical protein
VLTANHNVSVPFCGTLGYPALYVDFLRPGNQPTLDSQFLVDLLAQDTYNALLPFMDTGITVAKLFFCFM